MNSKSIRKLHEKKHRNESGLFIVEGEKNVLELLASDFVIKELFCTADFAKKYARHIAGGTYNRKQAPAPTIVEASELSSFGTLQTNNGALAIVEQRKEIPDLRKVINECTEHNSTIILALDAINDPGNLGTIIRIADWFGITTIIAGNGTVDAYNPKTIAATMGSFARVRILTSDLAEFLALGKQHNVPILGAALDGKNLHTAALPTSCILVMGSESHGIEKNLRKYLTQTITIPRYGKAESLNVAAATAIMLDALRK